MNVHRGMGGLLFVLTVGGLLLLFAWVTFLHKSQNSEDAIRPSSEELQQNLTDQGMSEEAAQYNVGIQYSLTALSLAAKDIHDQDGSFEKLCTNGKINRNNPNVVVRLTYVVCGPDACDYTPYILRSEANDKCYASENAYVVSGDMLSGDGKSTLCLDYSNRPNGTLGTPNRHTFHCD